jgi:hypothetical protein
MSELGLPTGKVSLEPPEDSFGLSSVFPIRVNLPTHVVEGLDSCSGPKMFKEFLEQVKGFSIPPKICAHNLFV